MGICINCNKELKENIQSFCEKCDSKLSYTEKEHLLSSEVNKAIDDLASSFFA